jgi:hypothetical protein
VAEIYSDAGVSGVIKQRIHGRPVPRSAEHRHDDTDGKVDIPDHRGVR